MTMPQTYIARFAMHKPHFLLLAGTRCDARLWQQQAAALAELAHVTVADLSQAESITERATKVLDQAPDENFALAGLSLGGYVALEIMRQALQRLLGLALLDTSAQADSEATGKDRQAQMVKAEHDLPGVISDLLPRLLHTSHLSDAGLVAVITAMANSLGQTVFMGQQRAMLGRINSRPGLAQISCPTLLVCGREQAITPLAVHLELAAAIAGAQLMVLDDGGHLSSLEQPERLSRT
jgi:pimeloyl-ACP methyl ester carboxylesterase